MLKKKLSIPSVGVSRVTVLDISHTLIYLALKSLDRVVCQVVLVKLWITLHV